MKLHLKLEVMHFQTSFFLCYIRSYLKHQLLLVNLKLIELSTISVGKIFQKQNLWLFSFSVNLLRWIWLCLAFCLSVICLNFDLFGPWLLFIYKFLPQSIIIRLKVWSFIEKFPGLEGPNATELRSLLQLMAFLRNPFFI